MFQPVRSLATGVVLLLASFAVNASPITIDSSAVRTFAYDGVGGDSSGIDVSTAFGARSLLSVDGLSSSSIDINWVDTGPGALLDFDINQTRPGNYISYAQAFNSSFLFTATADTTYAVSGQYAADDVTSAGMISSNVYLENVTAGNTMMFRDYNRSQNTLNESFTVGIGSEGDYQNFFTGSQSGNLLAGNQYRFYFNYVIQAFPSADGGASATGCVTLSIGGASGAGSCGEIPSVPEPMPLLLLGAGLAALGLRRRFPVFPVQYKRN